MKTPFEYDHAAAVSKACEYSSDPETLRALIERLEITVGPSTVIPSPWNEAARRPLKALHMLVTVNGYTFPYYGSHNDAEAFEGRIGTGDHRKALAAALKARKDFKTGLLYSLLCCVGGDYNATHEDPEDPEDLGFDRDSIKDMAKWNLTLACAADLAANPHAPASLRQFHAARLADLRARAERQRVTVRGSVFSRYENALKHEPQKTEL